MSKYKRRCEGWKFKIILRENAVVPMNNDDDDGWIDNGKKIVKNVRHRILEIWMP